MIGFKAFLLTLILAFLPIPIQAIFRVEDPWFWTPLICAIVIGIWTYSSESAKQSAEDRKLEEKRLVEELVPAWQAKIQELKDTGSIEFYNHDGIRNYGVVMWQDTNLGISSYKNVTTYTSVRSSYNSGSRSTKNKRSNRVNVGGTKGKREVIQESIGLGHSNLYITTKGIRLCGDFELDIPTSKLSSFRKSDYSIQINIVGKEFPIFIRFDRYADCQIAHAVMSSIY